MGSQHRKNLIKQFFCFLKDEGFRGSGNTVRRTQNQVIHVVNAQTDKYGDGFYINLGVHLYEFDKPISKSKANREDIDEASCIFRKRLSPPYSQQHWQDPKDDKEVDSTLKTILSQWKAKGDPYFSSFVYPAFFQDVITGVNPRKLNSQELLIFALISLHTGNHQSAFNFSSHIVERQGTSIFLVEKAEKVMEQAKDKGAINPAELREQLKWSKSKP